MRISDWSSDVCSSDLGRGGIYNFVTKRAACRGRNSKVSWTQVETGSAITWKYPSCILQGDNSVGEFYSVAITNNRQQADTGTKMIHIGKNTRSTIIAKGIAAGRSDSTYRSEEHTSELQSLMRISYAVLCLKKQNKITKY